MANICFLSLEILTGFCILFKKKCAGECLEINCATAIITEQGQFNNKIEKTITSLWKRKKSMLFGNLSFQYQLLVSISILYDGHLLD